MTKSSLKKILFSATALSMFTSSYFTYKGYKQSITPSKFELAASNLGFTGYQNNNGLNVTAAEQQEALLKQLQLAGYFKPLGIWRALNGIGKINDTHAAYQQVYQAIEKSNADSSDPSDFNAKVLRKNLAKDCEALDVQDIQDILLYIFQHAFGRDKGQERNELTEQNWMVKYKQGYLNNARELGLIDRIEPKGKEYDAVIIAGASRIGLMARYTDFNNIAQKYGININNGSILVLAGEREIWANLDGIKPETLQLLDSSYNNNTDIDTVNVFLSVGEDNQRTEEGKEYIKYLAKINDIKLDVSTPFYECYKKESCLPGRYPGRVYPNYAPGEEKKLTETLMAKDIINTYPLTSNNSINVVNTRSDGCSRPNTASTARDAAEEFVASIIANNGAGGAQQKEYKILLQTNNPYIERQTIATQREYDKKLKEHGFDVNGHTIVIEGIGFGCKQDVATVHSESAALMSEKWQQTNLRLSEQGIEPKRDIKTLLYQTRNNNCSNDIQSFPEVQQTSSTIIGYIQDFFDKFLE